jgi:3-oxoacid CoA-transferase
MNSTETLIQALAKRDNVNKLTAVSNNAGVGDSGLGTVILHNLRLPRLQY